eukprot:767938-Hanusia_phi.AAC.6
MNEGAAASVVSTESTRAVRVAMRHNGTSFKARLISTSAAVEPTRGRAVSSPRGQRGQSQLGPRSGAAGWRPPASLAARAEGRILVTPGSRVAPARSGESPVTPGAPVAGATVRTTSVFSQFL